MANLIELKKKFKVGNVNYEILERTPEFLFVECKDSAYTWYDVRAVRIEPGKENEADKEYINSNMILDLGQSEIKAMGKNEGANLKKEVMYQKYLKAIQVQDHLRNVEIIKKERQTNITNYQNKLSELVKGAKECKSELVYKLKQYIAKDNFADIMKSKEIDNILNQLQKIDALIKFGQ